MASMEMTVTDELRPATVTHRVPVMGDDGYCKAMAVREDRALIHRETYRGRFVAEYEDGSCEAVEPESVRFLDGRFDAYVWDTEEGRE